MSKIMTGEIEKDLQQLEIAAATNNVLEDWRLQRPSIDRVEIEKDAVHITNQFKALRKHPLIKECENAYRDNPADIEAIQEYFHKKCFFDLDNVQLSAQIAELNHRIEHTKDVSHGYLVRSYTAGDDVYQSKMECSKLMEPVRVSTAANFITMDKDMPWTLRERLVTIDKALETQAERLTSLDDATEIETQTFSAGM